MKKEIRVRCWIDLDGEKFFGPGRAELLELIQESGSIAQAARQMGMSYKKAWVMVDEMNTRGRKPFVVTQKGGQQGGYAEVTETGRKVVAAYQKMSKQLQAIVDKNKDLLKLL
ncbi:winged helix-turn-helix domain-containing protein [Fulvivirgaceae bacterium PWU5]|uniref:Winged helix-turn-helix domain-containing protein n=1 Tax=Dawidia cretensis TaxID=2782350 RepID=A0AAP2E2W2_9BACT|nr:winged helix-turn-helix domain-containing protein [Dawidia cretensis]MBT1710602.1 winged helix-turn-helix domain-containing protein [Dawidia cretensis]